MSDERIDTDPDFILLKRFDYSLEKALTKHPNGLEDHVIAQALGKSAHWVGKRYRAIVERLREAVDK